MSSAHPIETLSTLLKSSADPLRLGILKVLERGSFGVLELARIFGSTQSGMSHHLKLLASSGLVSTRKEGNSVFYRRAFLDSNDPNFALRQSLFATLASADINSEIEQHLNDVLEERAQTSKDFFSSHAKGIKEQEDLIAKFDVYGKPLAAFLNKIKLPSYEKVLEVGPGRGEFLQVLSEKFTQVIALDNSSDMLALAKDFSQKKNIRNVEFIYDDTGWCRKSSEKVSCVVANMVLHHIPSPAEFILDLTRVLEFGGSLLLSELCAHNEEQAKTLCGDLWLGFETEELQRWAEAAQLTHGESSYLALRNGFQIQLHQFIKHS